MINNLNEGGLAMIDIISKDIAIKCSWVKRLCDKNNVGLQNMANYFIPNPDGLFWSGNLRDRAQSFNVDKKGNCFLGGSTVKETFLDR